MSTMPMITIKARASKGRLRNTSVQRHKFEVGACVLHRGDLPGVKGAVFRVTGLLPDGGEGFQYRLKGERDGQERVCREASLEHFTPGLGAE